MSDVQMYWLNISAEFDNEITFKMADWWQIGTCTL
jgi:hypothetical protein